MKWHKVRKNSPGKRQHGTVVLIATKGHFSPGTVSVGTAYVMENGEFADRGGSYWQPKVWAKIPLPSKGDF